MRFSTSFRLPSSSSLRPLPPSSAAAAGAGGGNAELPGVSVIRKKLVLTALERPVRFRTDLDVLVIQQYLASLDAFAGVALAALHYLSTEATLLTLSDGDILCYQEDRVTEDSSAFVIIDGSLCGYFNKAFNQRPSVNESFQVWNARQARRHGVLIDFGEFQTTYSNGALCGFDDLIQGRPLKAKSQYDALSRRKGIDTLERMRQRFALSYEKGILSAKDTSQSELSYLSTCSQLSEYAKSKLLQTAPRRHLAAGEELCFPNGNVSSPLSTSSGHINALLVVLYGRLDVFWDGDEDAFMEFHSASSDENSSTTHADQSEELSPAAAALAERTRLDEFTQLRKTPLATIRRGQTFGDQILGLALDKLYQGAQLTSTSVPIRLTSGDAVTEIIWIPHALYEEHLREDRVSLSYHPLSSAVSSSSSSARFTGEFRDWAMRFLPKKDTLERRPSDLGDLSRRMLADSKLSKLLFQFPPLVLERMCHPMELRHFAADGLFLGIGDEITHVSIIVHGALRILAPPPSTLLASAARKSPILRTSSTMYTGSAAPASAVTAATKQQHVLEQFVPGDIFGAAVLLQRSTTSSSAVYVEADTLLLSVPRIVFDRWLAPLSVDTIFSAGSSFQHLATLSQPGSSGRLQYSEMRACKPAASPTRRQSMVLQASTRNIDGSQAELLGVNVPQQQEPSSELAALDSATHLLKKMGIFPLIPRFLLSELLLHTSIVHKQAGDILFHENEESQYLVVLLTGFLSFYSLEHMSTTIEMFQKHSFCHFSSFQGSQTNPEDFVADGLSDETASRTMAIAKHRAAMHGVHIQTLHAHNAFRTGVLLEGTICPATVVAQTNCECLVLEESVYVQLLKLHQPVIDLGKVDVPVMPSGLGSTATDQDDEFDDAPPPGSLRSIISQRSPSALHPAVVKCFERAHIPWLVRSPLKMQQLLRGMRCVSVNPGERLIRCNDVLDHLIIVLSGKLSLYIRQNEDVSTFLDASQRSVRSLMLERSVTSNYSTTSQQLYKEAHGGSAAGAGAGAGARGRIASRQDAFAKRKIIRNKISRISGSGLFVDSVLAAVHEERLQRVGRASIVDVPEQKAYGDALAQVRQEPFLSASPLHHAGSRATPSFLIHSAAAKAKLQQKLDVRRSTMIGQDGDCAGSLFLCHLGAGEVFGDEILAPHGIFRSVHDVFVDASAIPTPSPGTTGIPPPKNNAASGAQLLLLDRRLFHAINLKTDAEIEKELRVRSRLAKSKWQKAERRITRKLSQRLINNGAGGGDGDSGKGTSKLFDLFKNILNQRCFLTMRTIADIPLLRDLPDASKRELCLAARFEALERGMNAYKENGAHSSEPRYYFLLSGRIGLYARTLNGNFFSYSSSSSSSGGGGGSGGSNNSSTVGGGGTAIGAENCLREVLVGDGFGEFELLVPEFSRSISAIALESCRLLSFPASAFLRHWPHIAQMKSDIEYLRTRVPFFSRLELEKIAYLYTTLSFQTFTRASNIFEQNQAVSSHSTSSGELYLIKEGICAIRQRVVLDTQQTDGKYTSAVAAASPSGDAVARKPKQQQLPTHRPHYPEKHLFRVMVTVADVSDGHLFWINGGVDAAFPFTLQAVSASVTITNISIDKLRAILPRTQLAALESASKQMAALYKQQYEMAKRAVVTLMNEKRAAQMGMTANPTFLPVLDFQSPQKVLSSAASIATSSSSGSGTDTSIPFSRLLMSRPIDLVALQSQERGAIKQATPEDPLAAANENETSQGDHIRYWRAGSTSVVDAAYQHQHLPEHYQLENGLPNSTLVGSFPDDASLRRRRRSERRVPEAKATSESPLITSPNSLEPPSHISSSSLKEDECMEPELATADNVKLVGDAAQTKLSDSASHIHLEVKVPISHDPAHNILVEYPENITLTELDATNSLNEYHLNEQSESSGVSDAPIVPGEAQAMLRMSFVLTANATTRLILSAESAMEKRKWMKELRQACALGPRSTPMHQKILQPQDGAHQLCMWPEFSTVPQTPRLNSQSRGRGHLTTPRNASAAGTDLVLEVEYRFG